MSESEKADERGRGPRLIEAAVPAFLQFKKFWMKKLQVLSVGVCLPQSTIGHGEQDFPFAQSYLSHVPAG